MQKIKNKPQRIGLTGGIASGKSTVAKLFELLQIPVYYSDQRAKQLIEEDQNIRQEIIALLGEEAYHTNGTYNRSFVASQVFSDQNVLEKLNSIVHPAVFQDQEKWFASLESSMGIVESALIFESNSQHRFHQIIVVAAADEMRLQRIMNRDQISMHQAQARIDAQIPQQDKINQADVVIWNERKCSLIKQVIEVVNAFTH